MLRIKLQVFYVFRGQWCLSLHSKIDAVKCCITFHPFSFTSSCICSLTLLRLEKRKSLQRPFKVLRAFSKFAFHSVPSISANHSSCRDGSGVGGPAVAYPLVPETRLRPPHWLTSAPNKETCFADGGASMRPKMCAALEGSGDEFPSAKLSLLATTLPFLPFSWCRGCCV